MTITSRSNPLIVDACKLKDKKHRDKTGTYFFEGRKLFLEAVSSGCDFHSIFVTQDLQTTLKNTLDTLNCPIYTVSQSVYDKLSADSAPDGIFCIGYAKDILNTPSHNDTKFILSQVRDPGNLGSCIRSARAFSVGQLILHDCADVFNPKVIRSTMGGFFKQCMTKCDDIHTLINSLISRGYRVVPTALSENSTSLFQTESDSKTVYIIGNEGHGIAKDIIDACNADPVIIPMTQGSESLNACVAASILMWEQYKNENQ